MSLVKNLFLGSLLALSGLLSSAQAETRATFDATPLATEPVWQQGLRRYPGQTNFVTAERQFHSFGALESAVGPASTRSFSAQSVGGGERREVVDSDIFNPGPPGSKLLVLLNHARGLMIVDFARGLDQPQLVGRAPATGNRPSNMYVDWKNKKAIVIENWQRQNYGAGARILVYDLADLSHPKLVQAEEVGGTVNDSRLVGDVLYVVGHKQNPYAYYGDNQQNTSYAKSFRISQNKIESVAEQALQNHVSQENMGIQEVANPDGTWRYYITAITQKERAWWWSNSRSVVEVLDISSPTGEIKPVLTANATGHIQKHSWVYIQDNALIVTSNYRPENSRTLRIAVETYKMPQAYDQENPALKISSEEAQYRQLALARILKGQENNEEAREQLLSAGDLQLRGVFVEEEGKLNKPLSDFKPLDFGDTRGQSASVQDVRYVKDDNGQTRLHVFWVPANMVDPLDLVDVTDVNKRPKAQVRLEFEGWIQRSIPINFGKRRFILGLGFIVPAFDNPQNRRHAQAKIFEIKTKRGKLAAEEVDTLELPKVMWSDIGGQDKLVSFNFDPKTGKGSVLFRGQGYTKEGYQEGGQSVDFDLSKKEEVLSEGAFIQAEEGWLRRVFTHPGLDAMMTFSDKELGVFAEEESEGKKVIKTAFAMELARNIVAYYEIPTRGVGVQIVRKDRQDGRSSVEVRIVGLDHPDAERDSGRILFTQGLPGTYRDHVVNTETGQITILTADEKEQWDDKQRVTIRDSVYRINELTLDDKRPQLRSRVTAVADQRIDRHDVVAEPSAAQDPFMNLRASLNGLVQLAPDRWAFVDSFNQIWFVRGDGAENLKATKVVLTLPKNQTFGHYGLLALDGRLFLTARKPVGSIDMNALWSTFESYVGEIDTQAGEMWVVPAMVNVPGNVVGVVYDHGNVGYLTQENRVVDFAGGLSEPSLNLTLKDGDQDIVRLSDIMSSSEGLQLVRSGKSQWVFVEQSGEGPSGIYPMGGIVPRRRSVSTAPYRLGFLDVDPKTWQLQRTVRALDGQLTGYSASLATITPVIQSQKALQAVSETKRIVITAQDKIQVVEANLRSKEITTLVVHPVNTHIEPPTDQQIVGPATVWSLPSSVGSYYSEKTSVNLSNNRIRVALGDFGVCEAVLSAPSKEPNQPIQGGRRTSRRLSLN